MDLTIKVEPSWTRKGSLTKYMIESSVDGATYKMQVKPKSLNQFCDGLQEPETGPELGFYKIEIIKIHCFNRDLHLGVDGGGAPPFGIELQVFCKAGWASVTDLGRLFQHADECESEFIKTNFAGNNNVKNINLDGTNNVKNIHFVDNNYENNNLVGTSNVKNYNNNLLGISNVENNKFAGNNNVKNINLDGTNNVKNINFVDNNYENNNLVGTNKARNNKYAKTV